MNESQETLGERIQRLRLKVGTTQVQLADVAGVPVSTLRNWELDRREPSFRACCRIAKALGVTAEYLADTVLVSEVGRQPRPAGPTRVAFGRGGLSASATVIPLPAPAEPAEEIPAQPARPKGRRGK